MKASLLASAEKKKKKRFLFESDDGAPGCQHAGFISRSQGAAGVSRLFFLPRISFIFPSAGRHEKVRRR